VVYSATSGFYASYPWPWTRNMTLKSQAWSGGAASCTARLYFFSSAAVGVLMLALVPVALAGKGGNGGGKGGTVSSSSLALEMVVDLNNDGLPNWGDTVRFLVSNPLTQPNVQHLCSRNGTVVYSAQTGYYQSTWPWTSEMILKSQAWSGGAASCSARLYVFSGSGTTTLAALTFAAGA
jgi:hypothetical protein